VSNLYHNRKEIIIVMLNSMKFGGLCGNKDLDVINAKYGSFYAKLLKYKSNFQSLLRAKM
jgi:hypothetical protein